MCWFLSTVEWGHGEKQEEREPGSQGERPQDRTCVARVVDVQLSVLAIPVLSWWNRTYRLNSLWATGIYFRHLWKLRNPGQSTIRLAVCWGLVFSGAAVFPVASNWGLFQASLERACSQGAPILLRSLSQRPHFLMPSPWGEDFDIWAEKQKDVIPIIQVSFFFLKIWHEII